jgi:hypothetical protein
MALLQRRKIERSGAPRVADDGLSPFIDDFGREKHPDRPDSAT